MEEDLLGDGMAKTAGYTKFECDRIGYHEGEGGKVEYLADTDSRKNDWHTVSRVTADGNTVQFLFCAECWQAYKALATSQDAEFSAFRTAKKED